MIPKHQQINVWMNMSETPEKKKARLRYDKVCKTAWTDEFHFIKHSRKGNKFAFCEFCRTATECTILRPSEKHFIFSLFYHTIFKVLTTQILYPKCSILRPSEKKRHPPPTAFSLEGWHVCRWWRHSVISIYLHQAFHMVYLIFTFS
jgi:hypothetical protein